MFLCLRMRSDGKLRVLYEIFIWLCFDCIAKHSIVNTVGLIVGLLSANVFLNVL